MTKEGNASAQPTFQAFLPLPARAFVATQLCSRPRVPDPFPAAMDNSTGLTLVKLRAPLHPTCQKEIIMRPKVSSLRSEGKPEKLLCLRAGAMFCACFFMVSFLSVCICVLIVGVPALYNSN